MGGRPNPGTPADRRLGDNQSSSAPTPGTRVTASASSPARGTRVTASAPSSTDTGGQQHPHHTFMPHAHVMPPAKP
jgi:hypothetical protein